MFAHCAGWILNGHVPPAEFDHAATQTAVRSIQRRAFQFNCWCGHWCVNLFVGGHNLELKTGSSQTNTRRNRGQELNAHVFSGDSHTCFMQRTSKAISRNFLTVTTSLVRKSTSTGC